MALTKKDKEEVAQIIEEILDKRQQGVSCEKIEKLAVNTKDWEEEGVKSRLTGLIVAPENYWEYDEDGEKKTLFTWDEAMEIEKKLPDGWRLPTRSEWMLLSEEFGQDEDGKLDVETFAEALSLPYTGYRYGGSTLYTTTRAFYWSRTASNNIYAYSLYFNSNGRLYPQDNGSKYNGFAIRCVKEERCN